MRHQGILTVALVFGAACADGLNSDGSGGGGSSTGDWTGSTASSSASGSGSSRASASTSGASTTTTSATSSSAESSSSAGGGGTGGGGGGDETPPTVVSVTPVEGATAVLSLTKLTVTFSEAMAPGSITATTNSTCSGSVQISSDDFSSCVPVTGGATTSDDITFTLSPTAALGSLGQYRIRVTAGATDPAGNALSPAFQSGVGFQVGFRHTVTIDGINDFFPMSDTFATSTAGTELYVTHDETDLFVGLSSPDIAPQSAGNKFVYFLFSTDPSLVTGNALSSDGKARFGTNKAMTWHYKERIAGGTYSEYRVGDPAGWANDWGTQNKASNVATGFLEARIALSELGGAAPASLSVTAYTVDYAGDGGNGWLYNMFAGATDGSGAQPRDVVRHVALTLPAALVPNDASHLATF